MAKETVVKNSVRLCALAGALVATSAVTVSTQGPATRLVFLDIRGGRVVSIAPDGSDVKVLVSGRSGTPDGVAVEPNDLDLDLAERMIYWTDQAAARAANTVSRAPMSPRLGVSPSSQTDQQILMRDLKEAIGIALDLRAGRLYATDSVGRQTAPGWTERIRRSCSPARAASRESRSSKCRSRGAARESDRGSGLGARGSGAFESRRIA